MTDQLTMETLEQHHQDNIPRQRRRSSIKPEGSESTTQGLTGPNFRRMSRIEPRASVQYGLAGRRPSQASRRTSVSWTSQGTKHNVIPVRLQNTYRMQPESKEKFNPSSVEKMMKGVLESYLDGEVYEHKMCANLAQNLSDVIKSRVKDLGFPRYKLVCNVLIGENANQALIMTSRCLWNSDTDNFAQAHFSKGKLYAIATVFATYFE
ncbi:dynein light chain Tctex-type 5-like [Saccostrea echinata]|uniref:dynein light chain Tctex-type 5-like n=1 Tax=Saccostrea echinata TaxID=191078 RepID=UPI002A802E88|nr:dynein light chain Tctex-type 5-like [Saccostrea echinata]